MGIRAVLILILCTSTFSFIAKSESLIFDSNRTNSFDQSSPLRYTLENTLHNPYYTTQMGYWGNFDGEYNLNYTSFNFSNSAHMNFPGQAMTYSEAKYMSEIRDESFSSGSTINYRFSTENIPDTLELIEEYAQDPGVSRIKCEELHAKRLERYSEDTRVKKMLRILKRNSSKCIRHGDSYNKEYCPLLVQRKDSHQPTGFCFRYVKYALQGSGLVHGSKGEYYENGYLGESSAKNAGTPLEQAGFENIMSDELTAENAPVGAVLVYSGGKHGHIEVKTGKSEYTSDYVTSVPRSTSSTRTLTGVYILKDV